MKKDLAKIRMNLTEKGLGEIPDLIDIATVRRLWKSCRGDINELSRRVHRGVLKTVSLLSIDALQVIVE